MTYKESALEFLGIKRWHELGYTGKGIKIMSDEKVCEKAHPDVISPAGFKSSKGHGDNVMAHIKLVAPDAELIAYPMSGQFSSTSYKSACVDYIKENDVDIFTTSSLAGTINSGKELAIRDCKGCIFFVAAGNDGEKGLHGEAKSDVYYAIGGVKPTFTDRYGSDGEPIYDWGNLYRVNYSSTGEELDFVTLAETMGANGTSFCSPLFAAQVALVQQFFKEKANRKLTKNEMEHFILDYTFDLEEEGHDIHTGHGIFRLPEPDDIPILEYMEEIEVGGSIDYTGFKQEGAEKVMSITEMFLTPNPYSRPLNKLKPTAIAWHYIGNPGTSAIANRNYFENLKTTHTTKASSHFIIGLEGEILQLIPCDEISYCTNQANSYAISVECCHPDSTGRFTEATYNSMVWLGRYLMQKYGIKNNIRHYDVTKKCCPKWFVDHPQEWEKFKKKLEGDKIMLEKVIEKLGITENELVNALTDLVGHKLDKDKRPDWLTDELYERIKERKISDMTRLNDYATRAEVATMVNNAKEE